MIGQHTQKHCVTEPGNGKRSEPEESMLQEPPNKLRIVAARGRKQAKSRRPTARRGKILG